MFKSLSTAHQGWIYLIKNIVKMWYCEILWSFKIYIFNCNIYLRLNYSKCWSAAQETFIIILNVENSCVAYYESTFSEFFDE